MHVAWNRRIKRLTVHALRPIAARDELLATYLDYGHKFLERQSYLRRRFGFDCVCALCSLPRMEREDSDSRQQRIKQIDAQIAAFPQKAREPQLMDLIYKKTSLFIAEGLPAEWLQQDMLSAFSRFVFLGDMDKARQWLLHSIAAVRTMEGNDCDEIIELNRILALRYS